MNVTANAPRKEEPSFKKQCLERISSSEKVSYFVFEISIISLKFHVELNFMFLCVGGVNDHIFLAFVLIDFSFCAMCFFPSVSLFFPLISPSNNCFFFPFILKLVVVFLLV